MPNKNASNLTSQSLAVEKHMRASLKNQQPMCIWLTGLSGAGKSALANELELRLHHMGRHTYLLDGDNVRLGINSDLGFSDADRAENIRRVAELAKLMVDAGLIVITAFISPFRTDRALARAMFQADEFLEVYVDTPLEECMRRDPKGLYEKALKGSLQNFTGVGSRYEPPEPPDIHIKTPSCTPAQAADRIVLQLQGICTRTRSSFT